MWDVYTIYRITTESKKVSLQIGLNFSICTPKAFFGRLTFQTIIDKIRNIS